MTFQFRPIAEEDLAMLHEWRSRAHVTHWWGPPDPIEELREDFVTHAHEPRATRAYIASVDGQDIGFIQSYCVMGSGDGWWEAETDPGARGIDQFLALEADLGHGLGRAMIRAFVDALLRDPDVTVVQTDPDPTNERAIRCYLAAGFQSVGRVETPDGEALLLKRSRE